MHSIELLRAEIEKEEAALQMDRATLRRLERDSQAEQRAVERKGNKVGDFKPAIGVRLIRYLYRYTHCWSLALKRIYFSTAQGASTFENPKRWSRFHWRTWIQICYH